MFSGILCLELKELIARMAIAEAREARRKAKAKLGKS
jgi:hypothetical protein